MKIYKRLFYASVFLLLGGVFASANAVQFTIMNQQLNSGSSGSDCPDLPNTVEKEGLSSIVYDHDNAYLLGKSENFFPSNYYLFYSSDHPRTRTVFKITPSANSVTWTTYYKSATDPKKCTCEAVILHYLVNGDGVIGATKPEAESWTYSGGDNMGRCVNLGAAS